VNPTNSMVRTKCPGQSGAKVVVSAVAAGGSVSKKAVWPHV